jgi:predicted nucleic-acid-binding protein
VKAIAHSIRELIATPQAAVDSEAAEAGLVMLEAGGDFADGVITYEGRRAGGRTFVSFDRAAVKAIPETGGDAAARAMTRI